MARPDLVLQLIAAFYNANHHWPQKADIWRPIVRFIEDEPTAVLPGYTREHLDPECPNAAFYADVRRLLTCGYLVVQCDELRLTAPGLLFAAEMDVEPGEMRLVHLVEMAA